MAGINDTTFELTRVSALDVNGDKDSTHFDMSADFKAVLPPDLDPMSVSEADVYFATGCPKRYLTTAAGAGIPGVYSNIMLCNGLSVKRWPTRNDHFMVSAKFTTNYQDEKNTSDESYDPNDATTWITYAKITRQMMDVPLGLARKDKNGKVYANSAGERFRDTPNQQVCITCWQAYQYVPSGTTITTLKDMNNVLNNATFETFPADTLKAMIVDDEYGFYGTSTKVRRLLIEFQHNPDKWIDKVQDWGYHQLIDPAGKKHSSNWKAMKNGGESPLNGSGVEADDPAEPADIEFTWNDRVSFASKFKVKFAQ